MANVFAVHSAGSSIAAYLRNTYPDSLRADHPCAFQVLSSGELDGLDVQNLGTALTLFLYSVTVDEHFRSSPRSMLGGDASVPLSLDLHFLMTAWAGSALAEQTILTWAMLQLHQHPFLLASDLSSEAGWQPGDVLQIVPEEISTDTMMTIWDAVSPTYRLSVSYAVRVVRVDAEPVPDGRPVVATRFAYSEHGAPR